MGHLIRHDTVLFGELVHYRRSKLGSLNDSAKSARVGFSPANYYASARSQSCFSDPKFRYRPRPSENCLLRIRWASSMPAKVMAALPKDLKPPMEAHRRLMAR